MRFMVGAGVLLAVIAFVSYKIGIFILGAGIGIGLGIYVFHPTTSLVFFFCLLLGRYSGSEIGYFDGQDYEPVVGSKAGIGKHLIVSGFERFDFEWP